MEGAAGADEGEPGRGGSPVATAAAGGGGPGSADRLRECSKSDAGARQRERTRDGCPPGPRGRTEAAGTATVDREPAAFSARRDSRFGHSIRYQGISAAHDTREPAATE